MITLDTKLSVYYVHDDKVTIVANSIRELFDSNSVGKDMILPENKAECIALKNRINKLLNNQAFIDISKELAKYNLYLTKQAIRHDANAKGISLSKALETNINNIKPFSKSAEFYIDENC